MAGVREKKAEKTRAKLVAAARQLFAKKGFAATSTEEILEKAGVTRGALYHHFTDKAALFEAVCVAIHEEAVSEISTAADAGAERVSRQVATKRAAHAWRRTFGPCARPLACAVRAYRCEGSRAPQGARPMGYAGEGLCRA